MKFLPAYLQNIVQDTKMTDTQLLTFFMRVLSFKHGRNSMDLEITTGSRILEKLRKIYRKWKQSQDWNLYALHRIGICKFLFYNFILKVFVFTMYISVFMQLHSYPCCVATLIHYQVDAFVLILQMKVEFLGFFPF